MSGPKARSLICGVLCRRYRTSLRSRRTHRSIQAQIFVCELLHGVTSRRSLAEWARGQRSCRKRGKGELQGLALASLPLLLCVSFLRVLLIHFLM